MRKICMYMDESNKFIRLTCGHNFTISNDLWDLHGAIDRLKRSINEINSIYFIAVRGRLGRVL